ncbi:MAG: hypothetical protein M1825_006333 [Sarcosagium campestre]|nr:MAG: hypothetical protein M1825_006333 [Sarcosagium campestre]
MAALHSALQILSPTEFTSVPQDDLESYLKEAFSKAQMLVNSVPIPDEKSTPDAGRSRSNTTSSLASSASEMSLSSARPAAPITEHAVLQKEWGKPLKLAAKDNPLGMSVYKLSGKDGRGSWFARRSVHEGLGFKAWKKSLQQEFPESLQVQGGPGEGNIRGIGGERKVETKVAHGTGKLEVYHLSAQFPGPTTPRDFVTLLITSSSAMDGSLSSPSLGALNASSPEGSESWKSTSQGPRHFMVISKPCIHPDCPPRDGFIRGEYESIEFIREIPIHPPSPRTPKKTGRSRAGTAVMSRDAMIRNASRSQSHLGETSRVDVAGDDSSSTSPGRRRSKTISFAEHAQLQNGSSIAEAIKEDASSTSSQLSDTEANPVEWIMITRSDPGGSVPRWMVERGTPSGIVSDAGKFLDWACRKAHAYSDDDSDDDDEQNEEEDTTLGARDSPPDPKTTAAPQAEGVEDADAIDTAREQVASEPENPSQDGGLLQGVGNVVSAGLTSVVPSAITSRLPGRTADTEASPDGHVPALALNEEPLSSSSSSDSETSSIASFATASAGDDTYANLPDDATRDRQQRQLNTETASLRTAASSNTTNTSSLTQPKDSSILPISQTAYEKLAARLADRKRQHEEKFAAARSRIGGPDRTTDITPKEAAALTKAADRYKHDVAKEEARFQREKAKLEERAVRERRKTEERQRKERDRDERARWTRDRDSWKKQDDLSRRERELLLQQVGQLQRENTALAARLGRLDAAALEEVRVGVVGSEKLALEGKMSDSLKAEVNTAVSDAAAA